MAENIEVRYQTAVEGLQVIAGGDGDAAEIAVQTLDMLRVQTEQPDRRHGIYEMPDGSRFHSGTGEVTKPEAVETGDDLIKPFKPVYIIDRENGLTQYIHEDVAHVAHAVGTPHFCDALLAVDDRRLVGVQFWFTPPEAVETGEPVAFVFELAKTIHSDGSYSNFGKPQLMFERPCVPEGSIRNLRALYASPVPDGEARRKALEEAAALIEARKSNLPANDPFRAKRPDEAETADDIDRMLDTIASRIRALAAIPTAGDATNGQ